MYNFLQKYKSGLIFIVKLLIIGGAYYIISDKVSNNQILNSSEFLTSLDVNFLNKPLVLISILLFTLFNWAFEIIKWKNLVATFSNISYFESLKQSLSSLTASLLTPNRIGEYGAKAIYYPKYLRLKIMFLFFWGNFTQMGVTVLFGFIGCLYIWKKIDLYFTNLFQFICWSVTISGLAILIMFKKLFRKHYLIIIKQLKRIPNRIHFKNLGFSILRYLIFSHQFYLLLIIFGAEINYLAGINIIFSTYLVASLIPGFVIFDWLIKGSVAVTLFGFFGINEILVLSVTGIMWILNFALPSIVGSYFVLTFNKFNKETFEENRISV